MSRHLTRVVLPRSSTIHFSNSNSLRTFSISNHLQSRRQPPPIPNRSPKSKQPDPSSPNDTSRPSPLRRPLTKSERENQRWYFFHLLTGTIFFGVLSFYGVSYYKLIKTVPVPSQEELNNLDLESVWMKDEGTKAAEVRARNYDDEINSSEWWARLHKIRQEMVNEASGDVLESAVGTGRNGEWYAKGITDRVVEAQKEGQVEPSSHNRLKSVTMVDVSEGMIAIAMEKWERVLRIPALVAAGGVPVRFVVGDLATEQFSDVEKLFERSGTAWPTRFDTIIQTNGLCSTKHPEVLLQNLAKLVKPNGKILLLEHGRSYYDMINNVLDRTAVEHAKKHGCLWNRDIEQLIKDSGLQIEYMRRVSFGTHYYFVLKPNNQI